MKKIGILFGMEDSFPWAFCEEVNRQTGGKDIIAEPVLIDKVEQAVPTDYAVIIDRISQDVPFYRAYLKNAAISGTAVINNPFWWSADEKFFNNSLAIKVGVPVPKTMLLPSKERPTDTSETSFRNMNMPLDWEYMFDQIGFPAYMKPHSGGGWKSVYRVESPEDLWQKHDETGQLVMLLQEEIQFTDYYRCYCLGSKYIHIMPYEPRNPHHLRYATQPQTQGEEQKKLYALMEDYILRLNRALGYDFNTIEFAIRDGIPYAIDFGNPAPDAEITSVGQANFDWIVEHSAKYAIERAKAQKPGQNNLTWGTFVETSVLGENEDILAKKAQGISTKPAPAEKKATAKKVAPKKAVAKKSATKK
jgi:hypothetical protein